MDRENRTVSGDVTPADVTTNQDETQALRDACYGNFLWSLTCCTVAGKMPFH